MAAGALAFAGAILLTTAILRDPPAVVWPVALAFMAVVWMLAAPRRWRWVAGGLLGAAWALGHACWLIAHELGPEHADGVDARLEVRVAEIPEQRGDHLLLVLEPQRALDGALEAPLPRRIRVRWYGAYPQVSPGETWRLDLRLEPPDGFLNPAGFDYQRWLFQRRIGATGYVRDGAQARRIAEGGGIDAVRARIAERIASALEGSERSGVVQALGVALRDGISDEQWQVLSETGTAHLLAISGLHVGLVAGAAGWLANRGWRWVAPGVRRVPALVVGTVAGLAAAGAYAMLAGLTLPTQRAWIMVAVLAGSLILRRPASLGQSWALALAAVLAWDPWAPLGAGVWLSFGAVAIIAAATAGRPPEGGVGTWLRVQVVISLALLPATAVWLQQLPWLSPLANALAVPWVSTAVVPPILAGVALAPLDEALAAVLWRWADTALAGLMAVLEALAERWGAVTVPTPPAPAVVLALIGSLLVVAPRAVAGRTLAAPLLALLAVGSAPEPPGSARIHVLDTGGGLSSLIVSEGEALAYGVGPGGSLGAVDVALAPLLEQRDVSLVGGVVPREGDPWSGDREQAAAEWPQAPWLVPPCEARRGRLGELRVAIGPMGDGGCAVRVRHEAGGPEVELRPRGVGAGDAAMYVTTRGCGDPATAGSGSCSAAVLQPGEDGITTHRQGAITLRLDGEDGIRPASARSDGGRVYHHSRWGDGADGAPRFLRCTASP